jgi:hypothetical protein
LVKNWSPIGHKNSMEPMYVLGPDDEDDLFEEIDDILESQG